jgi:hypothetical protein
VTDTTTIQPTTTETGWSRLRRFGSALLPYAAIPVLWVGRMVTTAANYVFGASKKVRIGVGLALVALVLAVVAVNVHKKTSFGVRPELPKVSEYYTKKELRELQKSKKKQPPKRATVLKPKAQAATPAPTKKQVVKKAPIEAPGRSGTRFCDANGWCWTYF